MTIAQVGGRRLCLEPFVMNNKYSIADTELVDLLFQKIQAFAAQASISIRISGDAKPSTTTSVEVKRVASPIIRDLARR